LAEQLANAFAAELEGESPGVFVPTLNNILRQVVATGGSVTAWQGILSTLRRNALPYLANDDEALLHAENLWQQARVMIGGEAERARAYQAFQAQQQANVLHEVGQALATSTTIAELADAMTRELPRLGIPSCYFSLYEDPGSPIESSRLILAYDKDERFELEAGGQRFPSYELTPDGAFRRENRYSVSLAPLYFGENQLGFALLEIGPQDARIHEPLRRQISGALQRALLIQQVKNHALQLQTAAEVSRAASSILDPDELIQQVVDLVRERFELYYAGLFLVDETKEWAVLQAGTGKAGQKMVRGGHKLQVGGDSMIGQCVATDQARIALDVGEEAVRFENPSLPQTRSELALPLISRGEAIGALTIQSAQEAAFSQEDITVLQTMADQLANAIQNARLFEETKSRLVQLTALQETTKAVASTLEPDKLLNLITQQATILLQSDGCMINLVDWEKKEDEVVAASGSQAHTLGFRTPLEGCLSGWVTLHNQPVISNQLQDDSRAALRWRSGEEQTQSAAIAPLAVKDQVIGTLVAMDKQGGKGEFDQADLDLLMTFAGQAAIAIQNARLFEQTQAALAETEDQARRLALLSELSEQLSRAADFDEIVNVSTAKVSQIFAADRVSVAMLSATGDSFDIFALRGAAGATPVGTRMEAKGTEMELAVRERRLVIRGNDPREDLGHIRSFMVAPLIAGREAIGTLNVASQGADTYTQSDGTLLLQTAALISAAIENSRLFKQTQDALEEVEATHRRYLERVWTEYLKTTKVTGYETERPGTVPLGDTVWPEIQQATEQQSATVSTGDGAEGKAYSALVAPVTLRGAAIGALGIHDEDGERQWSNDEIALIQTIADRMAVAAENLRLIEETQRRAARDRLTGEVTARMRETLDMETMLKTIVQEVRQTLGVPEVVVRLGTSSPLPRTTGDGHNRDKPGRPDGKERTA
jgi:GAF domain-containing protein